MLLHHLFQLGSFYDVMVLLIIVVFFLFTISVYFWQSVAVTRISGKFVNLSVGVILFFLNFLKLYSESL